MVKHEHSLCSVKQTHDNEGLTDDVRKTFLVHMISHNRTMPQLLRPVRRTFVSSMKVNIIT